MPNGFIQWPGWDIVRVIGRGSFGTVYEIHQDFFGTVRKAALKVITIPQNESEIQELFSEGYDSESITQCFKDQLEEIVKEVKLMLELKGNTNVVYCDDMRCIRHDDGIGWDIYIQMELLTPMMQALGKQVSEEEVIRLGKDICRALVLCRTRNIVHRDIKPQNIFVSDDGNYKLGDFGIAKTAERTTSGTKIGTYNYMAPEVYNNQPYGASADIYSLGLVLYWMLNERRVPFLPLGDKPPKQSELELARNRRFSGEAIPAPAHGNQMLKDVVLKACAFKPEDRFSSAEEMMRALELVEKEHSIPVPVPQPFPEEDEPTVDPTVGPRKEDPPPEPEPDPITPLDEDDPTVGPTVGPGGTPEPTQPPEPKQVSVPTPDIPIDFMSAKKSKKPLWAVLTAMAAVAILTVVVGVIGRDPAATVVTSSFDAWAVCVDSDGTVTVSGDAPFGEDNLSDWKDIMAVAAGQDHTVALKSNGTVVAAGDNGSGQCDVSGWRNIVAVAAGYEHTAGVKSDGTVVATGSNTYGQCDVSDWTDIVTIVAERDHTVGLKSTGFVFATGSNGSGQCDVSGWSDIVAIAAGYHHTVGLRSDGTVVATGSNGSGQRNVFSGSGWRNIVEVAAGAYHTVGLKKNGTVIATGSNTSGQCDVSDWTDIVAIYAGARCTIGWKADGSYVVAGSLPQ